MIEELVKGAGDDNYFDNVFSFSAWSAPVYTSCNDIENRLDEIELIGRTVVSAKIIGPSYQHSVDWIEQKAYSELHKLSRIERRYYSELTNIPPSLIFPRSVCISEPFFLEFDEGETLEVFTPAPSEYRFGCNLIPKSIRSAEGECNIDVVSLLSPIMNKTVVDIELGMSGDELDPFTRKMFSENNDGKGISSIILRLQDGMGICIKSKANFCEVSCVDKRNRILHVRFGELKNMMI